MQHNKSLVTLNLSHCHIGDEAAGGLFEGLRLSAHSSLEHLILTDNLINQYSVIDHLIPLLATGIRPKKE